MSITSTPKCVRAKYNIEGGGQVTIEGPSESALEAKLETLKAENPGKAVVFVSSEVVY